MRNDPFGYETSFFPPEAVLAANRTANPGRSAATGLEAFGEGAYKTAFLNLGRARRTMQLAGGSHPQRDVFERLASDSAQRAGFMAEAGTILKERAARHAGRFARYAATRLGLIETARSGWAEAGCLPAD